MKLVSLDYQKGTDRKQIVLLLLSESNDKYFGLRSNLLSDPEVALIRANSESLRDQIEDDLFAFLKKNLPSYSKAYRAVNKSSVIDAKVFKLG